ncbi:MAG: amidohydrolase family protein [Parafilimonas sp.]|nr:amidohydrolase family protein [Parafilimonas sp.]
MKIIDSHQHFWKYNNKDFDWITDDMSVIQKDFLPGELQSIYKENNIEGCVAVQVNQTEEENNFFLNLANQFDFIKGIVGWVDLMADDIEDKLSYWSQYKKIKGFRHILQGAKDRALMLTPVFKNGIGCLSKYNFTYDILIYPDQLVYALALAVRFPNQKFIIDHLAKPYIKFGDTEQWKKDMEAFKICQNVYCKISGMVTEADWNDHSLQTFKPYLDVVTETFGTKKIMFGSDWPVCLVAASYKNVLQIVKDYFSSFSINEQKDIFSNNAIEFYNL